VLVTGADGGGGASRPQVDGKQVVPHPTRLVANS
ncbi:uncharacterized protein METZ01_LOCUS219804, partial [marine metagenome]